jgi:tripartite-type tricarboxylate transporter receptor subunit TctC
MYRIVTAAAAALFAAGLAAPPYAAADEVADFYKGRTVEVAVAAGPGGGFNAYARLVAKHMGGHVPGKPNMIVKNMPGGGGRLATAWVDKVAPKNGAAFLGTQPGALVEPLLGEPDRVKYDPLKFGYIGSASGFTNICLTRAESPVKTFADLQKTETVFGGDQLGSTTHDHALMMKNLAGAKIRLVKGYSGTKTLVLALEQKEIDGFCGYAWASIMSQAPHLVKEKKINILVQFGLEPHAEMTKRGIPQIWDFVNDAENRKALELHAAVQVFGRPYIAPPGVPKARLAALQKAFMATMDDPAYQADVKKSRLDHDPASGERVKKLIADIFAQPAAVQKKARWAITHN